MRLFDFLKKKDSEPKNTIPHVETEKGNTVQFEASWRASDLTSDNVLIEKVVDKIVAEDPFQKFYQGMSDADFGIGSKRVFEYTDITTMNVTIDGTKLIVEGIVLGTIPEKQLAEIKPYQDKYLLTAYVYVTGGRYKEYDSEVQTVVEGSMAYNLDIFLQYTS